jgi:alkylhydroperoxidase family enzyme
MLRLPYPECANEKESEFGDLNIRKMIGHLPPPIFDAFATLGAVLVQEGSLPPALREIAIVKAAYLMDVEYELHHHIPLAKVAGVSDEALETLRDGSGTAGLTNIEAALVRFVSEVVAGPHPSDAALAAIREVLPISMILEIIVVVGHYMTVGRLVETSGIGTESFIIASDTMRLK